MNIEELKKAISEELEHCVDREMLLDIFLKFYSHTEDSFVQEEATFHNNDKVSLVPDSRYKLLQEDWEKYKRGELKATIWEDFENELFKNYGI